MAKKKQSKKQASPVKESSANNAGVIESAERIKRSTLNTDENNKIFSKLVASNDPLYEQASKNINNLLENSPENDSKKEAEPETHEEALKRGEEYIENLRKKDEELAEKERKRIEDMEKRINTDFSGKEPTEKQKQEQGLLSAEQREQIKNDPLRVYGGGLVDAASQVGNLAISVGKEVEDLASSLGFGDGESFQNYVEQNLENGKFEGDDYITQPEDPSGRLIRSVVSHAAPMLGISKATSMFTGAGRFGQYASGVIGDASAEAIMHDPDEKRLSQMAQDVPEIAPYIPDFLTSNEGSDLEQKALAGAEAAILDTVLAGSSAGLGSLFSKKNAESVKNLSSNLLKMYKKRRKFFNARNIRAGAPEASSEAVEQSAKAGSASPDTSSIPNSSGGGSTLKSEQELVENATKPVKKRIRIKPSTGERIDVQSKIQAGEEARKALDYVRSGNITDKTAREARKLFDQGDIKGGMDKLFGKNRGIIPEEELDEKLGTILKRGYVPDSVTDQNAQKILKNTSEDMDEYLNKDIGETLNSDEVRAYRKYLEGVAREARDLIPKGGSAQMSGSEIAAFSEIYRKMALHTKRVEAFASEGGRSFREFRELSEGVDSLRIPETVEEFVHLNGGEATVRSIIDNFEKLIDEGGDAVKASREASKQATNEQKGSLLNKYFITNFLGGIDTSAAVASGATAKTMASMITEPTAGAIHLMRGKGTSKINEALAAYKGSIEGFFPALGKMFKHSVGRGEEVIDTGYKFEGQSGIYKQAIQKIGGVTEDSIKQEGIIGWSNLVELTGNILDPIGRLQTMDAFLRNAATGAGIRKHAVRTALNRGFTPGTPEYQKAIKNLQKNPTSAMLNEAKKSADDLTFTKPFDEIPVAGTKNTNIGGFFKDVDSKYIDRTPGAKLWLGFLRIITNMSDTGVKHLPAGVNRINPKVRQTLAEGTEEEVSEQMARTTLGTGLLGLGTYGFMEGFLTGSNPAGKETTETITGNRKYDDNVMFVGERGDFIRYERAFDPFGSIMSLGADLAEIFSYATDEADEEEYFDMVSRLGRLVGNTVIPANAFRAFEEVFSLAKGNRSLGDVLPLSGALPMGALVTDIREEGIPGIIEGDEYARVTDADDKLNAFNELATEIVNEFKDKIPGLSKSLPPQLNYAGEKVELPAGLTNQVMSPTMTNKDWNEDPVNKELLRLRMSAPIVDPIDEAEEDNLKIKMPSKTINLGKETDLPPDVRGTSEVYDYELGPWEYHNYVKLQAGRPEEMKEEVVQNIKEADRKHGTDHWEKLKSIPNLKKELNKTINRKEYKEASDAKKKVLINKVIKENRLDAVEMLPYIMKQDIDSVLQEMSDEYRRRRDKIIRPGDSNDDDDSGVNL